MKTGNKQQQSVNTRPIQFTASPGEKRLPLESQWILLITFQEYQQAAADYPANCKIPILTFIIWDIASTATCWKGLRDLGQQCFVVTQFGFNITLNIWIELSLFLSDQISVTVKHCLPVSVNRSSALRNKVQNPTYRSDFIILYYI